MKQPYLVAKYVPDLRRMEPRNIGIVLWVRGQVGCRFLPTKTAAKFVNEPEIYERWVEYWTWAVEKPHIRDYRARIDYPRTGPEFLDGLKTTAKENYLLCDGGEVTDRVAAKELTAAVGFLFAELVAVRKTHWKTTR